MQDSCLHAIHVWKTRPRSVCLCFLIFYCNQDPHLFPMFENRSAHLIRACLLAGKVVMDAPSCFRGLEDTEPQQMFDRIPDDCECEHPIPCKQRVDTRHLAHVSVLPCMQTSVTAQKKTTSQQWKDLVHHVATLIPDGCTSDPIFVLRDDNNNDVVVCSTAWSAALGISKLQIRLLEAQAGQLRARYAMWVINAV